MTKAKILFKSRLQTYVYQFTSIKKNLKPISYYNVFKIPVNVFRGSLVDQHALHDKHENNL